MALFAQYAMAATEEALQDAGWRPSSFEDRNSTVEFHRNCCCWSDSDMRQGICLGSGIGNFDEIYDTVLAYEKGVCIELTRWELSLLTQGRVIGR